MVQRPSEEGITTQKEDRGGVGGAGPILGNDLLALLQEKLELWETEPLKAEVCKIIDTMAENAAHSRRHRLEEQARAERIAQAKRDEQRKRPRLKRGKDP